MTTYTYADERTQPRRRKRGRRVLTVLIVLLIVLLGLVAVADRVGASMAERVIGDEIKQELVAQGLETSSPEVSVGGFPFLTQVLAGEYESISIRLRDVEGTLEGEGVRLPRLDVEARTVTAPLDTLRTQQGEITAGTVQGTAIVAYASVIALINQPGLQLSERDGVLSVTAPLQVLGQEVTVKGNAELSVREGRVQVSFVNLSAEGAPQGTEELVNAYARDISLNLALPEMPFQLELQDVKAQSDGLAVTAAAQNVPLNQS
ncbi:LmeA family phospholipid-binding protein [Phytohabitans aurantiacus]|uniref:DUF2993 domain-containing protein n=1 Tax=Phytohabitans aurantiacus TaxID=3016789 RepID=A0ABQ5QT99_9ACTN|nr:DUF2993 domain-containing protein [Phytohabitans aurantiacus]GLH97444.1 hypothetical protein Pa4123_27190 [Phytohabitans aurantiacus]